MSAANPLRPPSLQQLSRTWPRSLMSEAGLLANREIHTRSSYYLVGPNVDQQRGGNCLLLLLRQLWESGLSKFFLVHFFPRKVIQYKRRTNYILINLIAIYACKTWTLSKKEYTKTPNFLEKMLGKIAETESEQVSYGESLAVTTNIITPIKKEEVKLIWLVYQKRTTKLCIQKLQR